MTKNIFYFRTINKIGGTENFFWEIGKKYKDIDITIYYDEADPSQLFRLAQYVRCVKRVPGEQVKCEKAFYNYTIDMIDDVDAKEHIFISHGIFQVLGYDPPINHPKLTKIIGVSQYACDMIDEIAKELGVNIKSEKCYNPLTLEKVKKPKIIIAACRLDDKVKGGERTKKLINALDQYCKSNPDEHYMFYLFSNPIGFRFNSPNVFIMQPRPDIRSYIAMADYIVQLSDDMETYCYTINEALGYGVPIITTPLSILKELPITDNEHIVVDWDCSNIEEAVRQIFEKEVKPFTYIPPKDNWINLLAKGKSKYIPDTKRIVTVQCIVDNYTDMLLQKEVHKIDSPFEVTKSRADELVKAGVCEIIKE